ncbi:hypothetical protein CAter10_0266 [Collimonas arenae]|nr:hypothetical protein CAter10_0266 [Collimonas arenae]
MVAARQINQCRRRMKDQWTRAHFGLFKYQEEIGLQDDLGVSASHLSTTL